MAPPARTASPRIIFLHMLSRVNDKSWSLTASGALSSILKTTLAQKSEGLRLKACVMARRIHVPADVLGVLLSQDGDLKDQLLKAGS